MSAEIVEAILCVETQLERIADSLEKLEKAAIVHGVQFDSLIRIVAIDQTDEWRRKGWEDEK